MTFCTKHGMADSIIWFYWYNWLSPWDFFRRNDTKAETPVLWPPDAKSWLIGKDSDAGRDWGQEEKGTTEDEMAGWHHWLDGRDSEWIPGVGDGQGGLACCDSWGRKESDTTEQLNWTELCNWTESQGRVKLLFKFRKWGNLIFFQKASEHFNRLFSPFWLLLHV